MAVLTPKAVQMLWGKTKLRQTEKTAPFYAQAMFTFVKYVDSFLL